MLVCAFSCATCTRDRGCSAHPVFPAPSVERGWKVTQGLILKARAFRAARMRTHILKLFEIRIRILPRHCEERSDEAIHAATCGAMNCFASLAMTVEAVGWRD